VKPHADPGKLFVQGVLLTGALVFAALGAYVECALPPIEPAAEQGAPETTGEVDER
jgi:hypothetical protein